MLFKYFTSFLKFKNKKLFHNWSASCITKARLDLVDPKYKANLSLMTPEGDFASEARQRQNKVIHRTFIKFHPSRVIHRYICNNSSGKIRELIIVRHDFQHYEDIENNLITFILLNSPLVDEYIIKCFKKSQYLSECKVIHNEYFDCSTALGFTISKEPYKSKLQLIELIRLINLIGVKLPDLFKDNILKIADFSISDDKLLNFYPMEIKKIYETCNYEGISFKPVPYNNIENIISQLTKFNYDQLSQPFYLHKIFKYILKDPSKILKFNEYADLKNLINNELSIVNSRDPIGILAHLLASRISSYQVFYLIYQGLCKYNESIKYKDDKSYDFQKIYKAYFDGKPYSSWRKVSVPANTHFNFC